MKLKELINSIVGIAKAQPNVNSTYEGDIYELNHYQDVDYCVFVVTQQEHQFNNNENLATFNFNFFFVDRLTANEDNVIDVQSTAVSFLETLVADIEKLGVIIENYNIHTFKERFNDICAGAYMTIGITTYIDDCGEVVKLVNYNDLKVLNATTNGIYSGLYKEVNVDVQQGELIAIQKEYNHNGSYDIETPKGYDGISSVEVRVQVEPILQSLEVTENGDYFPEDADGFSMVSVDVPTDHTKEIELITGNFANNEYVIPEGITSFKNQAFSYCGSLETITLPSSISNIPTYCFSYCRNLKTINNAETITNTIGNYGFQYCSSLESVIFPNVVTLATYVFRDDTSLKYAEFGSKLNSLGSSTFYNCTSLEVLDLSKCTKVVTLSNTTAFTNVPTTCKIRVPAALYDNWIKATNWSTLYAQGYNFEAVATTNKEF